MKKFTSSHIFGNKGNYFMVNTNHFNLLNPSIKNILRINHCFYRRIFLHFPFSTLENAPSLRAANLLHYHGDYYFCRELCKKHSLEIAPILDASLYIDRSDKKKLNDKSFNWLFSI